MLLFVMLFRRGGRVDNYHLQVSLHFVVLGHVGWCTFGTGAIIICGHADCGGDDCRFRFRRDHGGG